MKSNVESEEVEKRKKTEFYRFRQRCVALILKSLVFTSILSSCLLFYLSDLLYPEATIILRSTCKNPVSNWNGKLFNIPIWKNGNRPVSSLFSSYSNLSMDRPCRGIVQQNGSNSIDASINTDSSQNNKIYYDNDLCFQSFQSLIPRTRPVIMFGSHHKTGKHFKNTKFSHNTVLCGSKYHCNSLLIFTLRRNDSCQETVLSYLRQNVLVLYLSCHKGFGPPD